MDVVGVVKVDVVVDVALVTPSNNDDDARETTLDVFLEVVCSPTQAETSVIVLAAPPAFKPLCRRRRDDAIVYLVINMYSFLVGLFCNCGCGCWFLLL